MTTIGRLSRRLTLEAPVATEDDAGGTAVTWQPVATLWAEVDSRFGRERSWAEALTTEATHRITIRRRRDIAPGMRFTEGARVFDMQSLVDEKRRWTVCLCQERPLR